MGNYPDYSTITTPIANMQSMVAAHMLRAPQIQYRLEQERQKLANETAEAQARVANYNAEAEQHKAGTRETTAKAASAEQRNAAVAELQQSNGVIASMVDGKTPFDPAAWERFVRLTATATGKSTDDVMKGITTAIQARKAANGASPREVGMMSGTGATSIANQDSRMNELATRGTVVQPGAVVLNQDGSVRYKNPSAAGATAQPMVTEEYQAVDAVPAVPPDSGVRKTLGIDWLAKDVPPTAGTPAVPYQPKRTVKRPPTASELQGLATRGVQPVADEPQTEPAAPAALQQQSPTKTNAVATAPPAVARTTMGKPLTADISASYLAKLGYQAATSPDEKKRIRMQAENLARQDGYVW